MADNVTEARCTLCPPPDTQGYKELQMMLGKQRRIDYIQGYRDCLFRALSKEMLGHEKFHYLIRQILTKFIKENGRQFEGYVFEGTIEAHCKRMENLGNWGTQVENLAAAKLLRTEIYIFSKELDSQKYHWLRYKPISQKCTVNNCSEEIQRLSKLLPPKGYHIELIHSFEIHFDRAAPSALSK